MLGVQGYAIFADLQICANLYLKFANLFWKNLNINVLIQLQICEFLLIICKIIWRSAYPWSLKVNFPSLVHSPGVPPTSFTYLLNSKH